MKKIYSVSIVVVCILVAAGFVFITLNKNIETKGGQSMKTVDLKNKQIVMIIPLNDFRDEE